MEKHIKFYDIAPKAHGIMRQFEEYIKTVRLDKKLIELIKIRASQINGCAFCIDLHTKNARDIGETEQRIYCLSSWRGCSFYNRHEQLALELTEVLTHISQDQISDDLYDRISKNFNEKDFVDLIIIINTINSWNRLQIAMKSVPGD